MNSIKKSYIETFGCQMNERDSEIMGLLLSDSDYLPTEDIKQADVIVINTCSIREKAEQKVYSLLGRLKKLKGKKPSLIISVTGCVAQQEGKKLQARMPLVDIVLGPQQIYRLPELINKVSVKGAAQLAVGLSPTFEIPKYAPPSPAETVTEEEHKDSPEPAFKRFVTIMQGCNNFCTYCVVPYTRGRETSRAPEDIMAEITALADQGVKEVTLLGQNVNSYGRGHDGSLKYITFPELLRKVSGINGIERLRFTTSHPKDLSTELIDCFAEIDNLCPHFHLPVQSGSNRILKRMNRKYSIEDYLAKVEALRQVRPDIALTTDIIVGFPGETEDDFMATMDLLEKVRFQGAYSFKYSDRPQTKAVSFDSKLDDQVKSERLSILQSRQNIISLEENRKYENSVQTIMVEGESKNGDGQWSGRSMSNIIVNFAGSVLVPGQSVNVRITEGLLHSLRGALA
ncbi:MAG: tRNA (N6-isopentenyl adenosine(37)-C2)-methylthiotransferase MiaB [Deltaproteobacteria bacterium]|jgi:tRNA-2-methylthio-N6-dimethylallyladenosine synthase|nr:tRNA (N6-isopentenyl adenosine(37)-C2)-methylthiotransferase MiaB [Deltaproteobacteria bacterium]